MANTNPYRDLPSVDRLLADERVRDAHERRRFRHHNGPRPPGDRQRPPGDRRRQPGAHRRAARRNRPRPGDGGLSAVAAAGHQRYRRHHPHEPRPRAAFRRRHRRDGAVSRGYSNLEFDLDAGERGSRYTHLESVLRQLTGAEGAIAVNNNASALLLTLSALAHGREVIISRGQAVEIGGGFRIPDVMLQSGARLVEVGTTNRTYLRDYESAITPETVAIMRVHASNFRVIGFTTSPSIHELGSLAQQARRAAARRPRLRLPARHGAVRPRAGANRRARASAAGADLVLFSGDKLLGGPQAGVIVGREELIAQLRRHPLARAVRMDKASIAGLTATLHHYLRGEALTKVPVWRMIATPLPDIERRARRWARAIGAPARVVDGRSMIGGGSLPEESLPSKLVAIAGDGAYVAALARRLRTADPPVVARIEHDALLLDPRTVRPDEDRALVGARQGALETP